MNASLQFFVAFFAISIGCAKQPQAIASQAESDNQDAIKRVEPAPNKKKMKLTRFSYRNFREEVSRDSNSQTDIIRFDGSLLLFSDKWGGYRPSGVGGEMPPDRYALSPQTLDELETYFREKDLLKTQKEAIDTLNTVMTGRRNYRNYGQSLTLEYEGKTRTIAFSYKTDGPRLEAQEANPLNKKLQSLKLFLDLLRSNKGVSHKPYTKEEVQAQMFFRANGHKSGEMPTDIIRFDFSRYSELMGTRDKRYKDPQFSVNARGPALVVSHRGSTPQRRADCTMGPKFKEKFLTLLHQAKLYELKSGLFLSPEKPVAGMKNTKYEFEATFRRGWKVKTYLHFYDAPDVYKKDNAAGAWISKFETFDREFRTLLESKDCPKTKY